MDSESETIKQVIVVRKDLNMRKGKFCSQVAHAAMSFIINNNESDREDEIRLSLKGPEAMWFSGLFTKIVVCVNSEGELQDLIMRAKMKGIEVHPIIDSGKTEFNGEPTLTCAAFGPDESSVLDPITGNLKPL